MTRRTRTIDPRLTGSSEWLPGTKFTFCLQATKAWLALDGGMSGAPHVRDHAGQSRQHLTYRKPLGFTHLPRPSPVTHLAKGNQMSSLQHAGPVVIPTTERPVVMKKLSLLGRVDGTFFDENWLQATLYDHPAVLPIEEIDIAYSGCLPVCRELNTPAGPIDLLYVTPQGRLVIVETKLWRNPEARRTVVTQTLDYAKELATWDFDDLSREVGKVSGRTGTGILDVVRKVHPEINERDFADQVATTLRTGRFLLLIVGDGIREGVHALTDFLDRYGSLEFTFGLVEIGVYEHPDIGRLIHPRVLAKTAIIKRSIVTVDKGLVLRESGPEQEVQEEVDEEWAKRSAFYADFWTRFLASLAIDDASQPKAKVSKTENVYFYMPPSSTSSVGFGIFFAEQEAGRGIPSSYQLRCR